MPSEADKLMITKYRAGADEALALAREATKRALTDLEAGNVRDPGKLAMNASIASGTMLDKARVLNGEPTEITEHRDPKVAAAILARRLGVTIDSTAEEIKELEASSGQTPQP